MQIAVGLSFPGKLKDDSVICYLCKNFNLNLNIVEASFSMSAGWAILEVEGEEKELERAFQYLLKKEIKVQQIKKEK